MYSRCCGRLSGRLARMTCRVGCETCRTGVRPERSNRQPRAGHVGVHARRMLVSITRSGCAGAVEGDTHANAYRAFRLVAGGGAVCRDARGKSRTECKYTFGHHDRARRRVGLLVLDGALTSRRRVGAKSPGPCPAGSTRCVRRGHAGAGLVNRVDTPGRAAVCAVAVDPPHGLLDPHGGARTRGCHDARAFGCPGKQACLSCGSS